MKTSLNMLLLAAALCAGDLPVLAQNQNRAGTRPGDQRLPTNLKVGDAAPDFKLKSMDGSREVQLSSFRTNKPVVLVFGSYTCPPFRDHVGSLEQLYERNKDKAAFFMVYIREAHPTDGWVVPRNEKQGIAFKDPATLGERARMAETACSSLKIEIPCLVDGIDDAVNKAYSAWPDRVYIVDRSGKIAVMGAQGPAGFAPSVIEAKTWLEKIAQSVSEK